MPPGSLKARPLQTTPLLVTSGCPDPVCLPGWASQARGHLEWAESDLLLSAALGSQLRPGACPVPRRACRALQRVLRWEGEVCLAEERPLEGVGPCDTHRALCAFSGNT